MLSVKIQIFLGLVYIVFLKTFLVEKIFCYPVFSNIGGRFLWPHNSLPFISNVHFRMMRHRKEEKRYSCRLCISMVVREHRQAP